MRTRKGYRCVAVLIGVILVGSLCGVIGVVSPASATGSAAHPQVAHATSVVGTYTYSDSIGDSEALTLSADHTLVFSNGCSGYWVVTGKSISMDADANCFGSFWIYGATVGKHGLSSAKKPGNAYYSGVGEVTWYAVTLKQ